MADKIAKPTDASRYVRRRQEQHAGQDQNQGGSTVQEFKQDEWGSADAYRLAAEHGLSSLFDWLKERGSSWRLGKGKDGRFLAKDVRSWVEKLEAGEDLGFGEVPEGILPIPAPVEEQEAVAPVAEEVGAPEAIEAPEIIEVTPPTVEPEVVPEVAEERPAPSLGERIREFFAGIRMPEVRMPILAPIAGVALIALILFAIFVAVSAFHPQGLIRQRLTAPGQRIAALQDTRADLEERFVSVESEKSTLQDTVTELEGQVEALQNEAMPLTADNAALRTQVSMLNQEKADLQSQVSALETSKADLQVQVSSLQQHVATAEDEKTELQEGLAGKAAEVAALEDEKITLEDRVAKIAAEKAALESAFNKVTAERDQLAAKLEQVARVVVEEDDTIWDLLTQTLGKAPTRDQIQSVVDANSLTDLGVNAAGQWIVLIYAGQTIDLSPALSG